jgi:CDK-activating kinase assembly factor MAT1
MGPRAQTNTLHSSPLDDICPVCKSNRYLNPSLTFLINAECYHTMCTSCVDRLFTSGPAPCPVAGCHKTLRKRGFHAAFFGDLNIEREVDVRKRVGAVFNRRQEDFETLRDWNNYLEGIEDLVFRLTEGNPHEKREAEMALKDYAEMNRLEIEENERTEREEEEMGRRAQAQADERARRRREEARKREEEERRDLERTKREAIENLARSEGNAEEITRRAEELILEKTEKMKRDHLEEEKRDKGIVLRGLKKRKPVEREEPYDPFGGLDLTPARYVLQRHYKNEWLKPAESDPRHMVGGYSVEEYYARTMFEAFSGLGVFIEDEVANAPSAVGAVASATAGNGDKAMDDVF